MASKFEVICEFARRLIRVGAICVRFGRTVYCNNEVECPDRVFVLDNDLIENTYVEVKDAYDASVLRDEERNINRSMETQALGWKVEFLTKVKTGYYYCSHADESFEGYKAPEQPVPVMEPVSEPVPTVEPVAVRQEPVANALEVLEQAVAQIIAQTRGKALADQITAQAIESVREFIETNYGPITKKVNIETPQGNVIQIPGQLHERFDEVLEFVKADEPCYLVGPAGCGKNVLCKQVAEAKDLMWAGLKTMGVVAQLEHQGYRVRLSGAHWQAEKEFGDGAIVRLKSETQPLDIKRLLFPMAHPGYFRILHFGWYERTDHVQDYLRTYGQSLYRFDRETEDKVIRASFGPHSVYISAQRMVDLKNRGNEQAVDDYISTRLTGADVKI
jgi:hypothetical protein